MDSIPAHIQVGCVEHAPPTATVTIESADYATALGPSVPPGLLAVGFAVIVAAYSPTPTRLGTTIVALQTADAVVIAADSRESTVGGDGRFRRVHDRACKILERNGFVFAVTGVTAGPGGFDLLRTVAAILAAGTTLDETSVEINRQLLPGLSRALTQIKASKHPTEPLPATEYVLAHAGRGHGALVWVAFDLSWAGDRAQLQAQRRTKWPDKEPGTIVVLGRRDAILRAPDPRYHFQTTMEAQRAAKLMIDAEAADPIDGEVVGGPVDIVTLGPRGISWSARKQECGDAAAR